MLHLVREIMVKLRKEYEKREKNGSMTGSNIALDDITHELDKIDPIQGVWVEDYKIELFDPADGATIVQWNNPTPGMLDVAHAVRTFYAEGPNGVRKLVKP